MGSADLDARALTKPSGASTAFAASLILLSSLAAYASSTCPEEQTTEQVPTPAQLAMCRQWHDAVRKPSALPLDQYEGKLSDYLANLCHRDVAGGWKVDKYIRDTGPYVASYQGGHWSGTYRGTHQPVLVWYSPEMYAWLRANRPEQGAPAVEQPVPDGAIMVKEMYTAPAAACRDIDWKYLLPTKQAAAVMVRDSKGSHDRWFWGWYGWGPFKQSGWKVDWPADQSAPYPRMGFGQYCTNCHASAKDNKTFAALKNVKDEPGTPLVFLSQYFPSYFIDPSPQGFHRRVTGSAAAGAADPDEPPYNPAFTQAFPRPGAPQSRTAPGLMMPPETYDNVWVMPGAPTAASQYVTSDQCLGCHSAGGTGLQYEMTEPATTTKVANFSPYGTWRGSPMGLAGRDPIFFAQLASETQTFHPKSSPDVQDICLGCHGILGQRQFGIDRPKKDGQCEKFSRDIVDAKPFPHPPDTFNALANFGALARDGISCTSCHRMVLGKADEAKYHNDPQNKCVEERQAALNPGLTGIAKTFTGSFLVGPPDVLYGPFADPKKKPMKHALGLDPVHNPNVLSSELCGSCHTVHLPVLHRGRTITHTYEQTTYPEWAFSDFRTGSTPDGPLPLGGGPQAESCQGCHMPSKNKHGVPYRSKLAAIQEYTNFPQAEHTLPAQDIDLPVRTGFGKHTLVGLNVFLLKMAWQFADVFGIRRTDPMLVDQGIDSIPAAEGAMMEQAVEKTAKLTVTDVSMVDGALNARVLVVNRVGHKFPSGVGFRRAFLQFSVLDKNERILWSSGRTNGAGIIVDDKGTPIAGELWWKDDCSARIDPDARLHQPHYQTITRQDQAQIYQELVSTPPDIEAPKCGADAKPEGQLTTSFLSICAKVKDNRLLPSGFLSLEDRVSISTALGAKRDMADDTTPVGVGDDPDYGTGGRDSLLYRVPLADLPGKPASVQATLYYQATPPFFLQDRFCTGKGSDTDRLYYLAGKLQLGGPTQDWKLQVVTSRPVPVP
jgi:Cytochrome P460